MIQKKKEFLELTQVCQVTGKRSQVQEPVAATEVAPTEEEESRDATVVARAEGASRIITEQEVRETLEKWAELITNEIDLLELVKRAIYRMHSGEAITFMREHPGAILYQAKGLFVEEASGKLRALGVINEDHVKKNEEELEDTTQVEMTTLRVILRLGVQKNMQIRSTEVS